MGFNIKTFFRDYTADPTKLKKESVVALWRPFLDDNGFYDISMGDDIRFVCDTQEALIKVVFLEDSLQVEVVDIRYQKAREKKFSYRYKDGPAFETEWPKDLETFLKAEFRS